MPRRLCFQQFLPRSRNSEPFEADETKPRRAMPDAAFRRFLLAGFACVCLVATTLITPADSRNSMGGCQAPCPAIAPSDASHGDIVAPSRARATDHSDSGPPPLDETTWPDRLVLHPWSQHKDFDGPKRDPLVNEALANASMEWEVADPWPFTSDPPATKASFEFPTTVGPRPGFGYLHDHFDPAERLVETSPSMPHESFLPTSQSTARGTLYHYVFHYDLDDHAETSSRPAGNTVASTASSAADFGCDHVYANDAMPVHQWTLESPLE